MNTQRETKEFTTSGGNVIVYKTYLTGREATEIEKVYLKDAKVNLIGQDVKIDGVSPTIEYEAREKMLEMFLVSLNGNTENVKDLVLDLPDVEYQEITTFINELSAKKKEK